MLLFINVNSHKDEYFAVNINWIILQNCKLLGAIEKFKLK